MVTSIPDDFSATAGLAAPKAGEPLRLVLIDGSGFIFRAFHALPPMSRSDGTPVNAVYGYANMLAKLLREHAGTHLVCVFDAGRVVFRNRISADYKAHRPDPPSDLVPQFALIREATAAFDVPAVEAEDWEADDIIAAYARRVTDLGGEAVIVSSDKDLMQLVRPGVTMLDPIKSATIGPAEVFEKFGVPPEKMIEVQALIGDPVDNVPGVRGIGAKGAAQLITEYGDLEGVLAAAPSMKPSKRRDLLIEQADAARLSRTLVTLREDAPMPLNLDALVLRTPEPGKLAAFLTAMGFRSTLTRLGLSEAHAPTATPEPEAAPAAPFGPYPCVTDLAVLAEWIADARARGMVAIDTMGPEGTGLNGLSLATAPGRACYIPLGHALSVQLAAADVAAALTPLLANPSVLKVFHDAKEDAARLIAAGAPDPSPVDDVMLISAALDSGRNAHGLDDLSTLHLGLSPASLDTVTGTGRARQKFADLAPERAADHAAANADAAFRLWHVLRPRLRTEAALATYEQVERRMTPVLHAMEAAGVLVDRAELARMSVDFEARMAVMATDIFRLAGREFNLGSPKQLGELLFDELKLGGSRRGKAGAWSTDAAILQDLADEGHEMPGRILEWRQLQKLKITYTDALTESADAEGRVHTRFSMANTTTGRLSSTDPNLQNIPIRTEEGARIRKAFIAAPGHVLVSADYSQIELRLLAHVADIPTLRQSFLDGEDIHVRTASEVFGVPVAGMDSATRRRAKAINFGIIYGISAFGLARQLSISGTEARTYIDAYFARYPGIRAYMEDTKEQARIDGYVRTPFGRRCWVPGITEKNPARRAYAERQAINAPLQGGASDVIKRAMVRLPAAMADAGLTGSRLLLQVHDELLFEAPDAEAAPLAAVAKRVMEASASLRVPLVVETGAGATWGDAH